MSGKIRYFSLSFSAVRDYTVSHTPAFTKSARSKQEAVGIGIELARKEYPVSDGWHSHGCVVVEIPDEFFKESYK